MSGSTNNEDLFGPAFAARLERLAWILRRRSASGGEGDACGRRKGGLVEFAEHRDYAPGDDLRALDWNVYARLDRLAIKAFSKDEEVPLLLLLDASASMGGTAPEKGKLALQACAALAYLSLSSRNPVAIRAFRDGDSANLPTQHGTGSFGKITAFLQNIRFRGATDIRRTLSEIAATCPPRGMLVLVSDLMEDRDLLSALGALAARRREVGVLQILAACERMPEWSGAVRIVDEETGDLLDLDLRPEDLETFQRAVSDREDNFRSFAHARGIRYARATATMSVEDVILDILRRDNWFRSVS